MFVLARYDLIKEKVEVVFLSESKNECVLAQIEDFDTLKEEINEYIICQSCGDRCSVYEMGFLGRTKLYTYFICEYQEAEDEAEDMEE
jgi:hypothetical protein